MYRTQKASVSEGLSHRAASRELGLVFGKNIILSRAGLRPKSGKVGRGNWVRF
jgi:hypothetical protein